MNNEIVLFSDGDISVEVEINPEFTEGRMYEQ
jgi:hypothetical protein